MRIHTKLIIALITGIAVVMILFQVIQYGIISGSVSDLSESNIALLQNKQEESVKNIFNSIERSVASSLERGEMEKFERILKEQKNVRGLLEFSLLDANGIVTHTSDESLMGDEHNKEIVQELKSTKEEKFLSSDQFIEIFKPQVNKSECIRCHTTWQEGDVDGFTYFRFSNETLANAKQNVDEALGDTQTSMFLFSLFGFIFIVAVICGIMYYFIGKIVRRPLEEGVAFAQAVARGDLNQDIYIDQNDEIGELANAFRDMGNALRHKAEVADQITQGKFDVKLEVASEDDVLGKSMAKMQESLYKNFIERDNAEKVAASVSKFQQNEVNKLTEKLSQLAQGQFDVKFDVDEADEYAQETKKVFEVITGSLNQLVTTIKELINETGQLITSAKAGKLSARGNVEKFKGGFKQLVEGINETLDVVIQPINLAANYVSNIAKGEMPEKITETYHGDFNTLKDNLNTCIDSINYLIEDANILIEGAVAGQLNTRANVENHRGDFKKIIQGFNKTLDVVVAPVDEVLSCLEKMSVGDLNVEVTGDYQGDYARMKDALNSTLTSLNDVLSQVSTAVDQVSSGARLVSDSSQDVSQGATEQASSLEETSASMTEIGSQSRQNSENASQANQLASTSKSAAETGNTQMKQMLAAMVDINDSSGQISKIIKVIDEIAFQTNLLALNAAVEAARAGVHGKGFAVVAEEVRNLAQRSAKAAEETTELIEGSVSKVKNGTQIAQETDKALKEIVDSITKVTDLVGEIANASHEQVSGIEQINSALEQIDQVTQSNTASAEESASASEELSGQSAELKQMIGKFKLKGGKSISSYMPASETLSPVEKSKDWEDNNSNGNGEVKKKRMRESKTTKTAMEDLISLDDDDFGDF